MNIIIPIGGKGERFSKCGYQDPKPLIPIFGKPMILHVIDHLSFGKDDQLIIIHYQLEQMEVAIQAKYPNTQFVRLSHQTSGAAETVSIGLQSIKDHSKPVMLLDCDTFYTCDVISLYRKTSHISAVFYTETNDPNPIFSYINLDAAGQIAEIAEKRRISSNANTGVYCFSDSNQLANYAAGVLENKITFNGECYTSCIIDQMIKSNIPFIGIEINKKHVFNLGTPQQLNEYLENAFAFLFDLDGTLVLTDHIYYNVWETILCLYGIQLSPDIFKKKISGHSDASVVVTLNLYNVNSGKNINDFIREISILKDELFIKNGSDVEVVPGAHDFVSMIKEAGHPIAIVSNCNRRVAEHILEITGLNKYTDFIIIGGECSRPKPYPDPYRKALDRYGIQNKKAIIFEDSNTGLLSANGVSPRVIVGIETIYTAEELIANFANITIPNYTGVNIQNIIYGKPLYTSMLESYIGELFEKETTVIINDNKLKGGFISDVVGVKIATPFKNMECVVKLENKTDNLLSTMSQNLDLYNREYHFYESISELVPIRVPQFYGIVKNHEKQKIGILLENLNTPEYALNLNLNEETTDVSLRVIDSLAKMHAAFWNKPVDGLKKNNDPQFNPYWGNFVEVKWPVFLAKWRHILSESQIEAATQIANNFTEIQDSLSRANLTLCHGDVKSANIFYKITENKEPVFIDWQYIVYGKGVQDLVFFMIESFDKDTILEYRDLFKEHYYTRLCENGVVYDRSEYETDFKNAIHYFPFFVAMWFGTISEDELIDKSFPREFIQKLFSFISNN